MSGRYLLDTNIAIGLIAGEKGCPIPENDLWIATFAQQHDLLLLTQDFNEIECLQVKSC
jgi:predicted nucleic acid-binding protein